MKFLSHSSAGYFYNIPCLDQILGSNYKVEKDQVVYTVTSRKLRYQRKGHVVHLCTTHLPDNAVIEKDGQLVASPELVFLELSSELDRNSVILLGLQMCGHPVGQPDMAITTKDKLCAFLAKTPWHRGHRRASRALKYIKDGSASLAESLLYMALALPHKLGSENIKTAHFNYKIALKKEGRNILKQNSCYIDIYFINEKNKKHVGVDYNSFAHHRTPAEQGRDAQRAEILKNQGIKIKQIYPIQLYESNSLKIFASNLASELKIRVQKRAKKYDEMHAKLMEFFNYCKSPEYTYVRS